MNLKSVQDFCDVFVFKSMGDALSNSLPPKQKLEIASFKFSFSFSQGKNFSLGYEYFRILLLSFLGVLCSFISYSYIFFSAGGNICFH